MTNEPRIQTPLTCERCGSHKTRIIAQTLDGANNVGWYCDDCVQREFSAASSDVIQPTPVPIETPAIEQLKKIADDLKCQTFFVPYSEAIERGILELAKLNAELARARGDIAEIIPALERASGLKVEDFPANNLDVPQQQWAALWMARAILETPEDQVVLLKADVERWRLAFEEKNAAKEQLRVQCNQMVADNHALVCDKDKLKARVAELVSQSKPSRGLG